MRDNSREVLAREEQLDNVSEWAEYDQDWYNLFRYNIMNCKKVYYEMGSDCTALINDDVYDEMERRIEKIETDHPDWVVGVRIDEMVGYDPS